MLKVQLLSHTAQPERIVACAAKMCYSSAGADDILDGLTDEKTAGFLDMLNNLGHESPFEHASFTFAVEGVSRTLLAQLTRHRIASYSVKSQRYVNETEFSHVTPPEIEDLPEAREVFMNAMRQDRENYEKLFKLLFDKHFDRLIKDGEPKKQARVKAEKSANEDARYVLPNACETKLIVTMNVRSLWNFFELRCCNRAQWEIRALAEEMLKLCRAAAPGLFKSAGPGCVSGPCPEGRMSCGKITEVRKKYAEQKGY